MAGIKRDKIKSEFKAINKSEKRDSTNLSEDFDEIFDAMEIGSIIHGPNAEIIKANKTALTFLNTAEEIAIGRRIEELNLSVINANGTLDLAKDNPVNKAIKTKKPVNDFLIGIYSESRQDRIWISISSVPIINRRGGVKRVISTIIDATQNKIIEEKISEKEKYYSQLLETIPDLVVVKGELNEIIWANKAYLDFHGTTIEELNGVIEAPIPKFETGGRSSLRYIRDEESVIKTGGRFETEEALIRNDGEKRYFYTIKEPIKDINSNIIKIVSVSRDITERKIYEDELKNNERRFRQMFNNHNAMMCLIDPATLRFYDVNLSAQSFYGYDYKTFRDKSFADLCLVNENQVRAILEEAAYNNVCKMLDHKKADGSLVKVEVRVSKISYQSNRIAFYAIIYDITESFDSINRVLESEEKFRSVIDSSIDMIVMVDGNRRIVLFNDAALKTFGYEQDEILNMPVDLIYADPAEASKIAKIIDEKGSMSGEIRNKKKNGEIFYSYLSASIIRDKRGEKKGTVGVSRDITRQKKEEKQTKALLKISEAFNTIDNIDELYKEIHNIIKELMPADNFYIALYDEKTEIVSFPYFVDEKEFQPKSYKLSKGLTDYVIRTGQDAIVDHRKDLELRKSGEVELIGEPTKIWVGAALKFMGKTIGVVAVQDYKDEARYSKDDLKVLVFVSEQIAAAIARKKTEKELIEANEKLRISENELIREAKKLEFINKELELKEKELIELNANKDKFFSIIAHDLRSPFTGLMGVAQFMSKFATEMSSEELQKNAERIYDAARGVFTLLENLLNWSRLQIGAVEFDPASLNLKDMIEQIFSIYKHNAIEKKINLLNNVDIEAKVLADFKMTDAVFRNIINNALKFTPHGGEVKVYTKLRDSEVEIAIEDNGIGIAKEDIEKLFRIDVQYTRSGTNEEKGSGLGLILCKEFVEKNEGKLWVESKINKGSIFKISLPRAK